ncbi:MAG: hypothetical protein NTZ51_00935 [Proteobacteria bacterium]|nr:hypothetical protein [Pseudomonadota bacterium]
MLKITVFNFINNPGYIYMNDYKERTDGAAYRLCSIRLDTALYTYIIISILSMRDVAGEM